MIFVFYVLCKLPLAKAFVYGIIADAMLIYVLIKLIRSLL